MNSIIEDYGLRFYVKGLYVKNAAKRGGELFKPFYKKDIKPFIIKVKFAVNRSAKVLEKFPINLN